MIRRYGIDLGNVVIGGGKHDTSFFRGNYLLTPAVEGSFKGVKERVELAGPENVHIVSKAKKLTREKSLVWLRLPRDEYEGMNFFQYTGVIDSPHYVWFCEERRDKAPIAADLGLTDFVDDKSEVLGYLEGIVTRRILFGPQRNPTPPGVILLPSWAEASLLP